MSVNGEQAAALLRAAVDRLSGLLSPDTTVDIDVRRSSIRLECESRGRGRSVFQSSGYLGRTISPWLPRSVAARVAAHEAVELILEVALDADDCSIRTEVIGTGVYVNFELPNRHGTFRRVDLDPFPIDLCLPH